MRNMIWAALLMLLGLTPAIAAEPSAARTEVVLLGTAGGPLVNIHRAQPSSMLIVNGTAYLIDAGDGVTRQLALAGRSSADVKAVFLTHLHADHSAGVASLIGFRWSFAANGAKLPPLAIYGPPGTRELRDGALAFLEPSTRIFRAQAPVAPPMADIVTAQDVAPGIIYKDENIIVTAVENSHYATMHLPAAGHGADRSYSLRFETPDGSVVFTGDTGPGESLTRLSRGADLLVSEIIDIDGMLRFIERSTKLPEQARAPLIAHMTEEHMAADALARLASDAGVKRVLLTHFAAPAAFAPPPGALSAAVRRGYRGPVIEGADLLRIALDPKATF
ncbi:hypothetical protein ASE00_15290 [Sphingomonas sp. Root710]|uniref:MBL fold metallo-hydrolase n=1 Tax=Sphingomonas sp. Root710 TaxID=1736594 RepID=UPI0006F5B168|nr:MBL fold metallo-hydrolase [Sphingomonas sp. Root710]KRB81349.1 hypothetical protein ASE00_15290 [Sphingomonas sp. Root710]